MRWLPLTAIGPLLSATLCAAQVEPPAPEEVLNVFDERCAAPAIQACLQFSSCANAPEDSACFQTNWKVRQKSQYGVFVHEADLGTLQMIAAKATACLAAVKLTSANCWRQVPTQHEIRHMVNTFEGGLKSAITTARELQGLSQAEPPDDATPPTSK